MEYEPNPDVAPFQPANFMSSTILKKVPIPKRHLDTFGGYEYNFIGRRGVMLHTDRYQPDREIIIKKRKEDKEVDFLKSFDGPHDSLTSMTQRERLQAGMEYMEAMRGTRRRREMVQHRASLDLVMGGKQIEFEERFDIMKEIQKLKSLVMPKNAKDMFHGRGINLPEYHQSLHPRLPLPNDLDEEFNGISAPATLQSRAPSINMSNTSSSQQGRIKLWAQPNDAGGYAATSSHSSQQQHDLPPLHDRTYSLSNNSMVQTPGPSRSKFGKHSQLPDISKGKTDSDQYQSNRVSMLKERRTVSNLSARLGFLGRGFFARAHTVADLCSRSMHRDGPPIPRTLSEHAPPALPQSSQHPAKTTDVYLHNVPSQDKKDPSAPETDTSVPSALDTTATPLAGGDGQVEGQGEVTWGQAVQGATAENPSNTESGPGLPETSAVILPQIAPPSSESKVRPTTEERSKNVTPGPHPLRGGELIKAVSQDDQETLRQTFQRLDTDADGHLHYRQVKTLLPDDFSEQQERFTEEVYNMSNSITFFGIEEFMVMDRLSKTVESLVDRAMDSFSEIDFATLPQDLLKYVGKFDEADTGNTGKISQESLRVILADTIGEKVTIDHSLWDYIQNMVTTESTKVSKIEYIAHIPLWLSLERDLQFQPRQGTRQSTMLSTK